MKITWHTYERAEGKTTEAVELFEHDQDSIIIFSSEDVAGKYRLKWPQRNENIFNWYSFILNKLNGIHPLRVIIDGFDDQNMFRQQDFLESYLNTNGLTTCYIHIFTTLEPKIRDVLFHPNKFLYTERLKSEKIQNIIKRINDLTKDLYALDSPTLLQDEDKEMWP